METPKEYCINLKNGIITNEMLKDCLYSVNKRAKNCRDKEREYKDKSRHSRYRYSQYDTAGQYSRQKQKYYLYKEKMLSILKPSCIHIEPFGYERIRVYDYQEDYKKYLNANSFIWKNCYFDVMRDREVWFGDYINEDKMIYNYYLFYDMGDRSFHTPIQEEDLKLYLDIPKIEIDKLDTHGNDIQDLISVQFVRKVIEIIDSKEFTLIEN